MDAQIIFGLATFFMAVSNMSDVIFPFPREHRIISIMLAIFFPMVGVNWFLTKMAGKRADAYIDECEELNALLEKRVSADGGLVEAVDSVVLDDEGRETSGREKSPNFGDSLDLSVGKVFSDGFIGGESIDFGKVSNEMPRTIRWGEESISTENQTKGISASSGGVNGIGVNGISVDVSVDVDNKGPKQRSASEHQGTLLLNSSWGSKSPSGKAGGGKEDDGKNDGAGGYGASNGVV